jgi:hypothetical protein
MESVTILDSFVKNYFMSLRTMRLCILPVDQTPAIDITNLINKGLY